MQGFFVSNIVSEFKISDIGAIPENNDLIYDELTNTGYLLQRLTSDKFLADKLLTENERYIFLTEGVILKKTNLMSERHKTEFIEVLTEEVDRTGNLDNIIAPGFSLAFYDKKSKEWTFYTNQINNKGVFYYVDEKTGEFIAASSVKYITGYLDYLGRSYTLCAKSAHDLLTFGYNVRDKGVNTIVEEIKRIPTGCKLIIKENGCHKLQQYHSFARGQQRDLTKDEAVEVIDKLFKNAVDLAAKKNEEYGYRQISTLSGGLDSRMTTWVLHELGYDTSTAVTFAQSGSLDQKIAQEIAGDLRIEWIFKALDDAEFIKLIPEKIHELDGLCEVSGTIHDDSLLRRLNLSEFGLLHTGQLGDAVVGAFSEDDLSDVTSKAYSKILFDRINNDISIDGFDDSEMFLFATRCFLGALCPELSQAKYIEPVSPFCSLELLEFMFSLPMEWRQNHRIYKKWILEKYPKAGNYIWEKSGTRIDSGRIKKIIAKVNSAGINNVPKIVAYKLGFIKKMQLKNCNFGMNPYDYWYETDLRVRENLNSLYEDGMRRIRIDEELSDLIDTLYNEGGCREKVQAISVVYAIEYFFGVGKQ